MEFDTLTKTDSSRLKVKVSRRDKSSESFAQDVLQGLSANPKTLPKFSRTRVQFPPSPLLHRFYFWELLYNESKIFYELNKLSKY